MLWATGALLRHRCRWPLPRWQRPPLLRRCRSGRTSWRRDFARRRRFLRARMRGGAPAQAWRRDDHLLLAWRSCEFGEVSGARWLGSCVLHAQIPVGAPRPGQRLAAAGHGGAARAAAAGSGMPGWRPRVDLQVVAGVFGHMGGEAAGLAQGASCEMDLLDPRVWPGWRCGGGGISGRRGGGLGGCAVAPICRSSAPARWWCGCCLGRGSSVAGHCRWTWRLEAEDPRGNPCPGDGQDWRRRRPRVPLTFLETSPRDPLLIPWSCLRRETSNPWIGR